jgi:hypothetical protein
MFADAGHGSTGATTAPAKPTTAPAVSDGMAQKDVQAALTWAAHEKLSPNAIQQLQQAVGVPVTGVYDEATVHGVYHKQRELQPKGAIGGPGQATSSVFQHIGLIYAHASANANVSDALLKTVQECFPKGVSVAIYADLANKTANNMEFSVQAHIFATNHQTVGVGGGGAVLGQPVAIKEVGDVLSAVQSIHGGLLAKYQQSQPNGAQNVAPPPFTQVANLALFCHGEAWGMGMNENNDFSQGGLHDNTTNKGGGINPPNVQSFVKGLSGCVTPDVRVSLFACRTGRDQHKNDPKDDDTFADWTDHKEDQREGANSFAASMSQALGPQASVWAHTTAGHTTENFAARVFGADAGGSQGGGLQAFQIMYPEDFIESELERLFPSLTAQQRAARHDSLREQMWAHYKDCITGELARSGKAKRFKEPMGQEMFSNPDNARVLLHEDWTNVWIPKHLSQVKAG